MALIAIGCCVASCLSPLEEDMQSCSCVHIARRISHYSWRRGVGVKAVHLPGRAASRVYIPWIRHEILKLSKMASFIPAAPFPPNELKTRDDLKEFLVALLDPLASHTSPGGARIHLGHTATHYDEAAAQLEGFSRPIWGLASLLSGGGSYEGTQRWVDGFTNGADPTGSEYWGDMRDKDQRMVECSAIGFSLAVAKEQIWDAMSAEARKNLEAWLGGMNDKQMPNTNWLWFRVRSRFLLQLLS